MATSTDSMSMKLNELLKELRLDQASSKALDRAASSIIDAIKAIPEQEVSADDASRFVSDLRVPSVKAGFTFRPPEVVEISGSHSFGAVAKPDVNVDLLVRMPKECFHEKDYLNHRYHAKRCLYLKVIQRSLSSSPLVRKTEWTTFQNEARKPILLIYPVTELTELSEFHLKLIPCATSLFALSKLGLSKNNVRGTHQDDSTEGTPKYNTSILEDIFLEENSNFIRGVFHEWKNLEDAFILLKVWARNRSSIFAHDCLNGYLISIIMSYLAGSGGNHIAKSMSTMQIFRITLKFISSSMWNKRLYLNPKKPCSISKEGITQILDSVGVFLCDASGYTNLTFRMTRSALTELQDEAAWTLSCMDNCRDGGFEEIFMTHVDFAAKFDSCVRVCLKENTKLYASDYCLDDECWRICENKVCSLLQEALTDRAKLVRVTWRSTPSNWDLEDGISGFGHDPLIVGILVSTHEQSFRVVDIGPNAENKEEATKFRKFWGEKSELRRFRDGTIAESTVWECEPWERHLIIKKMTEYILMKHLSLSNGEIVHIVDQLDFCLHLGDKDPMSFSKSLADAFEILSKRLRLLEEIPLKISSVQATDPAFRQTSVFPPEPHALAFEKSVGRKIPKFVATCLQPVEVTIQLEGSGNWPLDSTAIEKTKTAFLIKIGESLQKRWGMFCTATEDDVDVLMSGYAFRLKILHERGLNLMMSQGKGAASMDKELFLRGQHSSMINGLIGRYPLYGPVVRLAKRWICAHLFSSCLKEEAIELVVAYLFVKPYPFHAPCSRITGFLRFLRLLSNYDWIFAPLIVDINGDFTPEDEKEINEAFILSRKSYEVNSQDVEPAMFLATTYDKVSEAWTKFSPNKSVLKRMASYARSSADLLTNLIHQGQTGSYAWECVVRTPLNNYDAVVLLHQDKLCNPKRLLFPAVVDQGKHVIHGKASKEFYPYVSFGDALKNLEEARSKLMVDFDPANYFLEDLKEEFPDIFKVWYDSLGGDVIGLTWEKKGTKKRRRDDSEEPRKDPVDILKTVGEIGKGFVKSVYLLKTPRLQQ